VAPQKEAKTGRSKRRTAVNTRFTKVVALAACAAAMIWVANGIAAEKSEAKPDFKKMDTDNDAKITVTEFDAYIAEYPELGLTKAVFQRWDKNSDGTVTLEEYTMYKPMEEKAEPSKEEEKAGE
jgi:Ca2+-binding EF-hand superfamily protein